MKHLILTRVRSADPCVALYSSVCITKEIRSVSGKTDSPVSFFPLLAEFPSGVWVLTTSTYLPWLLRSMREGAQGGAPSDIQTGTGGPA